MTNKKAKELDLVKNYDIEGLKLGDIIEPLRPLLATGSFVVDSEKGKIVQRRPYTADWDGPWYHTKHHPDCDCGLWHKIMFDYFKFVPSGCMTCWKVVVRPKYLEDLLLLLEMQEEIDMPSKCGIESRTTVFGTYGGYFYNRSQEDGQKCHELVCKKCQEYGIKFLQGKDGPVLPLLKRGCTEFEMELGPSDKWKQTPEQKALEQILTNHVEIASGTQPGISKAHTVHSFIKQAYSLGDPTVWQFNDNKPFYKPYVTYHKKECGEYA